MGTIYKKEQLKALSKEELMDKTNDRADLRNYAKMIFKDLILTNHISVRKLELR